MSELGSKAQQIKTHINGVINTPTETPAPNIDQIMIANIGRDLRAYERIFPRENIHKLLQLGTLVASGAVFGITTLMNDHYTLQSAIQNQLIIIGGFFVSDIAIYVGVWTSVVAVGMGQSVGQIADIQARRGLEKVRQYRQNRQNQKNSS